MDRMDSITSFLQCWWSTSMSTVGYMATTTMLAYAFSVDPAWQSPFCASVTDTKKTTKQA
jgi:hypothetical protein